jgi:hypothetical protein
METRINTEFFFAKKLELIYSLTNFQLFERKNFKKIKAVF